MCTEWPGQLYDWNAPRLQRTKCSGNHKTICGFLQYNPATFDLRLIILVLIRNQSTHQLLNIDVLILDFLSNCQWVNSYKFCCDGLWQKFDAPQQLMKQQSSCLQPILLSERPLVASHCSAKFQLTNYMSDIMTKLVQIMCNSLPIPLNINNWEFCFDVNYN